MWGRVVRSKAAWMAALVLFAGCEKEPVDIEVQPAAQISNNFRFIRDGIGIKESLTASKVLGVSGGQVELLGHRITVPQGAVTTPTIFQIVVPPSGFIEVQLFALVPDLFSSVGEKGFLKPVTLALTYSRSPDKIDPKNVFIAYVDDKGKVTPLKSRVNTPLKNVSADLTHFSKYCMASN